MGIGEAPRIAATLLAAGKSATLPVVIVENASLPNMRIHYMTLSDLQHLVDVQISGPGLILLGPQFIARSEIADVDQCRPALRKAAG